MATTEIEKPSRVSRRDFLRASGVGVASTALGAVTITSASAQEWHQEADVLVVGTGGAALCAAAGAIDGGASVIVLEKGVIAGGTTAKSGGVYWVPNNHFMLEKGLTDERADALHYMARFAFPQLYVPSSDTLGLSALNYRLLETLYDQGNRVVKQLHDGGAMKGVMYMSWDGTAAPDYFAHAPENKAPRGRAISPLGADGVSGGAGSDMIRQLSAFAEANGTPILTEHRATKIVRDETGRVVGLEVETPEGLQMFRARRGVVFGSGGFTHNAEMRDSYLRLPIKGGCAVPTNEGDLVNMAIEIGAKLGNMNEAWHQQEILEEVLQFSSVPAGQFFLGGDSMIAVNKYGQRMYSEKYVYNERTRSHLVWDGNKGEYPNLYQFMIFDEAAREFGGVMIPAPGAQIPSYIVSSDTIEGLAAAIQERLDSLEDKVGPYKLDEKFVETLSGTIKRFNGYAETGVDLEFHRGETPIEKHFHQPGIDRGLPNAYLSAIADKGPYHAVILSAGTLDTKGGPVFNENAQVLDVHDEPIPGLYVAGNASASPSGQAYWGAGGTLGLAVTFGYLAGEHAAKAV